MNANSESEAPTWERAQEILKVCLHPPYLRRTVRIALIVGTILFAINQLDVVLSGRATVAVWMKSGLTYLVPFCVSNYGVLVATRRRPGSGNGQTTADRA